MVASLPWLYMCFMHGDYSSPFPKLVLIDRDGVLNEDVGSPGVISVSQFQLIGNAGTAIGKLRRRGSKVALITNQSCVGKGLISEQKLNEIHKYMQDELLKQDEDAIINRIYFCTSTDFQNPMRKPAPGMILQAMNDFKIDPSECVMIGDTITDLQGAAAAKVPFRILVSTGYGSSVMGIKTFSDFIKEDDSMVQFLDFPKSILPFHYLKNFDAAVDFLLKSDYSA
mmetsp:Transcript_29252/g.32373  ORF Transcript_29252/g.32373 Transcript_29252/m.32373 type:complete len:226 (+) Transcript_29252:37-714(+)